MSGGANNGAWEGGVIWGLANYGNPKDFEWAVSTGVSAGSINTAFLAAYAPDDLV
jgi:predicted acylesterase/phospholipase RssA